MKATSPFLVFLRFVSKKHQKNGSKIQATILPPQKHQKVVPGIRVGYQNGSELTSESPKIHKMLQKSCFLTLPFFKQISRHKKTHFGQFLVSKWEGGRHEPGPMGREPEGGFHPPWRVITTSRSETEWNVNTFWHSARLNRG